MSNDKETFKKIIDSYPQISSYICFARLIKGREYSRAKINRLMNDLVCKDDYSSSDKGVLLDLLVNYSKKSPSGPYTNIIGFNLKKLRENVILQKYIEQVKYSNCIYIYRWGDLPLWGEVLHYLYEKKDYIKSNLIKYYHKSHNKYINN